jgi:uncharacterized protein (TIGR02145 family)
VTYTWSVPSDWGTISGQGSNSITVTAGSTGGEITVTPSNSCGSGTPQTLTVTVSSIPLQPGTISGPPIVTSGAIGQIYSVDAVSGATEYEWTLPSGWSGSSTTRSITVTAGTSGGSISVKAKNSCGSSDAQTQTLTVTICGAYTAPDVLKAFMCHNLGADENADPFTPAAAIHGAKYKWGLKNATLTQAEDQNTEGSIGSWTSKNGTAPTGSANWDMANANPCPAGYRVPTQQEWDGILSNNKITKVGTSWTGGAANYFTGMKVGNSLFLPAAGYRGESDGTLNYRGHYGFYWSSTYVDRLAYGLYFDSSSQYINNTSRSYGFSVRCIVE